MTTSLPIPRDAFQWPTFTVKLRRKLTKLYCRVNRSWRQSRMWWRARWQRTGSSSCWPATASGTWWATSRSATSFSSGWPSTCSRRTFAKSSWTGALSTSIYGTYCSYQILDPSESCCGTGSEIHDPVFRDPDPGVYPYIPDRISGSLVTTFWVKNTSILCQFSVADPDPRSGLFDPGSGMEKSGSGINIPDPQHWIRNSFIA